MNNIFHTKPRSRVTPGPSRIVAPTSRLSSAQHSIAALAPVPVTVTHHRNIDPQELRLAAARAINLRLLLEHLFDGSVAAMAAHLEMSPDRLRSLIDLQVPFDPEIAEHLEKILRLPGGWLDNRRTSIDAEYLRTIIFDAPAQDAPAQETAQTTAASTTQAPSGQANDLFTPSETNAKDESDEPAQASLPSIECEHEQRGEQPQGLMQTAAPHEDASGEQLSFAQPQLTIALNTNEGAEMAQITSAQTEVRTQPLPARVEPAGPSRQNDAMAQTLRWLNTELDKFQAPEGVSARIALRNRLGRAQSTVSTWLNGLRKLPDDMHIPLARALIEMELPITDEALRRLFEAAPHVFSEKVKEFLLEAQAKLHESKKQSTTSRADNSAEITETTPNQESDQTPIAQAHQIVTQIDSSIDSKELKLVVARAAEKVADVLQRLIK